jgi:D-xylose transport system substrate-binding protein
MKTIKFCLILVLIPLFFGCNISPDSKKKIGFLIRTYTIDRCAKERDYFVQRANELGVEVVIANANDNDKLQIEQGIEMIKNGVDVLVIFPVNGLTAAQIVREAKKHNVKVIAYESLIQNCSLDYFVTANNEKGGELMTEYIVKKVPKGNFILIGGDKADKNAVLIKKGQHKILDPLVKQGNIKIIYDVYADWTADEGYYEIMCALNLSGIKPDAIIASNDGLASGIALALSDEGLSGELPLTGLDGELAAFQRIVKGSQSVTIYKPFKKQAYVAAELAVNLSKGQKPDNIKSEIFNGLLSVPTYLVEPIVIDKTNINDLIKEGVFSEKEIFQ